MRRKNGGNRPRIHRNRAPLLISDFFLTYYFFSTFFFFFSILYICFFFFFFDEKTAMLALARKTGMPKTTGKWQWHSDSLHTVCTQFAHRLLFFLYKIFMLHIYIHPSNTQSKTQLLYIYTHINIYTYIYICIFTPLAMPNLRMLTRR
jgi:hypothetical protein